MNEPPTASVMPSTRGTVLLFHGLTSSPEELTSLRDALVHSRFSVGTPPLAGHTDIEALRRTRLETWLGEATAAVECVQSDSPLFIGGLSFGALLSLALVLQGPRRPPISGLILLAPPFRLRRRFDEGRLNLLSRLPEDILDKLGTRKKDSNREKRLVLPRRCLGEHSIASAVRMAKLRTRLKPLLPALTVPTIIVQDPHDHLVDPDGVDPFIEAAEHAEVDTIWLPGAEHELTLGPRHEEVSHVVIEFLNRLCLAK